MSLTASILKAIFDHPLAVQQTGRDSRTPATPASSTPVTPEAPPMTTSAPSKAAASAHPAVDVDKIMQELAASRGENLDWKRSVVDLLKTVGLDSSHEARVRLAQELHYPGSFKDTTTLNEWLHDAVLKAIENNGGRLPDSLK